MHAVGVGDLHDAEAERRLHGTGAPDACHEPEPFEVIERRHHRLIAAPRKMGEPFERWKHPFVFLGQAGSCEGCEAGFNV
jgi:hypothetical protein